MWRGWFYTTHANDQKVADVTRQSTEELLGSAERGRYYYRIKLQNDGGLVTPVQMDVTFENGTVERIDLPVDVWRANEREFVFGLFSDDELTKVVVDPDGWFADIDRDDNEWVAQAT